MIGKTIGHYTIVALIGRGGMGEVYRARDTKLDRDVALKVLPADMASDPARLERFEREAKTVAGLNHPHIVTLFSVEENAGVRFLTMELVEGQGLDTLIPANGLPLAKVFDIGIAIADALAAAHEKGIIHRDVKPANVMIAKDGRVKVLDFGLAKLAERASPENSATQVAPITTEDTIMGTVPYMSPEQLRGQHVDARSDIFSLGAMLYEMTTGRRPFGGDTNADISSAILTTTPAPITQVKEGLPVHLGRIVSHCLEKDPQERAQSALDVRNELRALRREVESGVSEIRSTGTVAPAPRRGGKRRWTGIAAAVVVVAIVAAVFLGRSRAPHLPGKQASTSASDVDPKSIAVLPFVNMSSDKEQEYFSDGISEELLNLLAKIPELKVVARTSSFSFKGTNTEIPEIARQLHVAHILEGSVRRSGDQVRITAQLVHAADGFHLWSETYDRRLDDVFKIQDEIASRVVAELKVTLLGEGPKARTTDPKAYALHLRAVQLGGQFTAEAFAKSDSLYREVLAIDPRYAPAWNGLSRNSINETASLGLLSNREGFALAREAAEKALEIDPDYAAAYARLGTVAIYGGNDLAGAAKHFERALALDPTDLGVLGGAATLLETLGRPDEALAIREAIVRRDPVNVTALFNLGGVQGWTGRYDAAIASFRTVVSLSPGRGGAHLGLGQMLLLKGDAPAALAEIEQETIEVLRMIGLPMAYHALGRKADSDAALAALITKYEKETAYNIASVHAFRGEADQAFEWLEKAVEYEDAALSGTGIDKLFANIHNDPRWRPFLRKIGTAPEQLAKIEFHVTLPEE